MRAALPKALFLAFTGTPLIAGEERTKDVFGDYVAGSRRWKGRRARLVKLQQLGIARPVTLIQTVLINADDVGSCTHPR